MNRYRNNQFRNLVYRGDFGQETLPPDGSSFQIILAREATYPLFYSAKNFYGKGKIAITKVPKKGSASILQFGLGTYTLTIDDNTVTYASPFNVPLSTIATQLAEAINDVEGVKALVTNVGETLNFETADAMDNYNTISLMYSEGGTNIPGYTSSYISTASTEIKGIESITTDRIRILNSSYEGEREISRNYGFDRQPGTDTFCFPGDPVDSTILFCGLLDDDTPEGFFKIILTEEPTSNGYSQDNVHFTDYYTPGGDLDYLLPPFSVIQDNPLIPQILESFITKVPIFSGPAGTQELWKYGFFALLSIIQDIPGAIAGRIQGNVIPVEDFNRMFEWPIPKTWRENELKTIFESITPETLHAVEARYPERDNSSPERLVSSLILNVMETIYG